MRFASLRIGRIAEAVGRATTPALGDRGATLYPKRALRIEGVAAIALLAMSVASASAQTRVGDRVFLHTIFVGQPGVSDDLTLPSFSWSKGSDGTPTTSVSGVLSKRITENTGVVIIEPTWTHIGSRASGFQNLTTAFKYMPLQDAEHQLMMCLGLQVEWGGTGSTDIGASSFSTISPQIYIGKGFGDLPTELSWLYPLALTGQFGLELPTKAAHMSAPSVFSGGPTVFNWGLSLQYYPTSASDNSSFHLAPLVEAAFQTPIANALAPLDVTTGTINTGVVVLSGKGVQFTTEAIFPTSSLSGRGVEVAATLSFSFGELAPQTLGQPLFR